MATKGEIWAAQTNAERELPVIPGFDPNCETCWGTGIGGWQDDEQGELSTLHVCLDCEALKKVLDKERSGV